MANNINIQRGSKNSQDKIGKPLFNTKGKSRESVKETLNTLTFIYNNYGNAHNPFTYNRDGIYVGNNIVSGTTRAYYSKDLSTSLQFHQTMMNYKSTGSAASGTSIMPGFVGDTGMIHFMMPGSNFDVISSSLSFRNLEEAANSFGDVNNILSYYPKDYVEDNPTKHGGFSGDIRDWSSALGGEQQPATESFTWTDKMWTGETGEAGTTDTTEFNIFKYSGNGDIQENASVVKTYLGTSDKDGNEYVDLSSTETESIFNDLVGSVKNSVETAGIYNIEGTAMSDAWTKVMTNAYFGIISDIQYNVHATQQSGKSNGQVARGASSLDPSFKNGASEVTAGEVTAYTDNTAGMRTGYKSDEWQSEYDSITNTNTTENSVQIALGATDSSLSYYNYLYGDGTSVGSATSVNVSDLFSSGTGTVSVHYDGTVAPVTNSSDYATYTGTDGNRLNTVIQSLDSCTYHPQNVFDEISHLFEICNQNFVALGTFVTQTNKMLVDDVTGKLIPAIAANTQTGIAQVQYKVNSLAVQQESDSSTLSHRIGDISAMLNDVSARNSSTAAYANDVSVRVGNLSSNLSNANTTINGLSSKLTDVSTRLNDVSTRLSDVSTRVNDVSTKLNDTSTRLNDASTRLKDVSTRLSDVNSSFKNFKKEYHFTGKRLYGPITVEPGETYSLSNTFDEKLTSETIGCVEVILGSDNSMFRWKSEYSFTDMNGTCYSDQFEDLILHEAGHYIIEPVVYVMLSEEPISELNDGNGELEKEQQSYTGSNEIYFEAWSQYANSDSASDKKVRVEFNIYKFYSAIGGWSAYVPGADEGYITVVDLDS